MQLTLCVKRDLHGCIFLNKLLPQLAGHEISVLLSEKYRPAEGGIPALAEMAFLERNLPIDTLFPLIDSALAAGQKAGECLTFNGMQKKYGFSLSTVTDRLQLAAVLESLRPELVISARFSHIFTSAMLVQVKHGIINIHPAALPSFAGLFGPMRTLAEGHDCFTCAVHLVDQGIDSGPLLHVARLPIKPGEGLLHQIAEIYPLAIPYLLTAIARLSRGEVLMPEPQDTSTRRYRSFPSPAEVAEFVAGGGRFWDALPYQQLLQRFQPKSALVE
ncbi:MAG: methionyl-tRNA formyltransferase [Dechloromonas sp.]|uniref:phosphoribosylglycinamide formyltransferase 1 n=1 Tax=Candidatus Dechloromonas phosphorivorans TaxID=2899244 RepID=A0A935JUB3_9RHOO|nr:methionyl-tRNA formyltransferase [Candidatus Dechloromonas phosphorivorans]